MYIIDFERINYLTSHPNDKPEEGYLPLYIFNTTRSLIKQYMEIYQGYNSQNGKSHRSEEKYDEAVAILRYNKILLDESDIRNEKIEKILE